MPQLDYHTFVPQLVWLAITFVVLYVLMSRLALPKVRAAIDGRRHQLDSDLGSAAALKDEAEATLAAYQKTLSDARTAAQEVLRQTGEKLAAEAAERQHQLAASLAEQIAAAEARIAAGKEQALGEIRGIAAEVGTAVVEKLTGAAPDAAAMSGAVGRALNGRGA
ncbi:MAG TPA: F0F1 ATP synthase subunit B' [Stellaceae bacterium]|jgi:F-type H+-transporting ATPase subunit b|nr:F0F1 ATP synthase subunit B' [Stellaceae bacterium]